MLYSASKLFQSPHGAIMEFFLWLLFPGWSLDLLLRRWALFQFRLLGISLHTQSPQLMIMAFGKSKWPRVFVLENILGSSPSTQSFAGHCRTIAWAFPSLCLSLELSMKNFSCWYLVNAQRDAALLCYVVPMGAPVQYSAFCLGSLHFPSWSV